MKMKGKYIQMNHFLLNKSEFRILIRMKIQIELSVLRVRRSNSEIFNCFLFSLRNAFYEKNTFTKYE